MSNVETTQKVQKLESFKGFPLFNEIEDTSLRRRNQAVIMTNILEDNFFGGKCSAKGAALLIGYMDKVPEAERKELMLEFMEHTEKRGFKTE